MGDPPPDVDAYAYKTDGNGDLRCAVHRNEILYFVAPAGRHGVGATSAPRVAPGDAFDAEPSPTDDTMHLHRFQKICRTGGGVAAA